MSKRRHQFDPDRIQQAAEGWPALLLGKIPSQRPYSPQPSFPPLPVGSSSRETSPVNAGPGVFDEGRRRQQDTFMTSSPSMADRKNARAKKLQAAQAMTMSPPAKCDKCEETLRKQEENAANYFKELEHLRRALTKMIEAARAYIPASVLRALQESLQLDVRYFSTPAAGEGGPLPPLPVVDVEDQSALIEKLKKKIADQEDKIDDQDRVIKELEAELKKALEALKNAGISVPSGGKRTRKEPPRSTECQTDPWMPHRAHGDSGFDGPDMDYGLSEREKEAAAKGKSGRRGPGGQEHDEGERYDGHGDSGAAGGKIIRKGGGGPGDTQIINTGIDPEEHRRLQAELELLKMKLAAAERQLKELEALKAELEALKKLLAEKDALLAELQARIDKLQSLLDSKGDVAGAEETKKGKKEAEEQDKKKKKKASGAVKLEGGKGGRTLKGDKDQSKRKLIGEDGEEQVGDGDDEGDADDDKGSESDASVAYSDKCVGNGPGKGMQDEPLRCTGYGVLKDEELNKTGRVYDRNLASQPALGLTNSRGLELSTPDSPAGTLPLRGKSRGLGPGIYSGGSAMDSVQFASSWSSKSAGNLFSPASTWKEAEPYLQQVWEQHPKGHRMPAKKELVRLGALTPQKGPRDRMAQTLPALNPCDDASLKANSWLGQKPPKSAGASLDRSLKARTSAP